MFLGLLPFCSWSQQAGDYRSIGSGNWNNPTIWQRYNGTSWTAAIAYPGQNANVGEVLIGNGNTVTLNVDITSYAITDLVIGDRSGGDDILLLPNNGDFTLDLQHLIIEADGILEWVKNADLRLPEGAIIANYGGTISTSKNCNASQVIYIGTQKFSTCNGNGGADYSFEEIESALPPPQSDGDQTECAQSPIQTLTASATPPANAYVEWFANSEGGSAISPTWSTVGTVTYYAESVDDIDSNRRSLFRTAVQLTILPGPTISMSQAPSCNFITDTYAFEVTVSSGMVTSTAGTATSLGANRWRISNVPGGTNVVATVTAANSCARNLPVSSPNCFCPVVNAPVSGGDQAYCSGDPVPPLTATVNAGETVDWYSSASGGTLLLSGAGSYTPAGPGTYYAEARNTVTGCTSSSRTAIALSRDDRPTATIGPDQVVFAGTAAAFTATATGANAYQWQRSTDGGATFTDLANGSEYSGVQTLGLTINQVPLSKNGYQYRLLAIKLPSSCPPTASEPATLRVRVRSVLINRNVRFSVDRP